MESLTICIQDAIKSSFIWLGKKILEGTFLISDFIFPIFCLICVALTVTGAKKPKIYAGYSIIIYLFIQVFRIFL